jgi:C-terminal processing protease CtpA/Prc
VIQNNKLLKTFGQGLMMSALSLMWACDPVPRRELTPEEKQADMMWLYSKFGANYAPLEYKTELFGLDYNELKSSYLEKAADTQNNDEFYALIHQFIAEFKDAHVSASLTASGRPGRETVAYLGFSGRRQGKNYVVTELFPTIDKSKTSYPIKVGSVITKINGIPLDQHIKEVESKHRTTGRADSDLTFLMSRLFARLSTSSAMPQDDDVTLTLLENGKETDVTVPWVRKDLFSFQREQQAAAGATKKASVETFISTDDGQQIPFSFVSFSGNPFDLGNLQTLRKSPSLLERVSSLKFKDDIAGWTTQVQALNFNTPRQKLQTLRQIPENALMIEESTVFPAYVFPTTVNNNVVMMGYLLVDTFSPQANPMPGVKAALKKMQAMGIEDLVIDTVNNGGGSLFLLLELAQALSNKEVQAPSLQIGLNDGWIDSIEDAVYGAASDGEREIYRRILNELLEYRAQGLRISPKESAYSVNILAPFYLKPNQDIKKDFNIVLMVNEMCASACDIFAGVLQDNKMATIIGSQTMGAGGNVVSYWQAPNSNMDVSQTESLIVRSNGEYIENLGVEPDVKVVTSEGVALKYEPLRALAVKILTDKKSLSSGRLGSRPFSFELDMMNFDLNSFNESVLRY